MHGWECSSSFVKEKIPRIFDINGKLFCFERGKK
jgi:hypothetical protein